MKVKHNNNLNIVLEILSDILKHHNVEEMKNYIQHANVSTYEHCISVAVKSYSIAKKLRLDIDIRALIFGAFLHDFYLYDWHTDAPKDSLHGFSHPRIAAKNAKEILNQSEKVTNIIKTHMWPLTLRNIPKSREAWLVCICDKYISTIETIRGKINVYTA